MLPRHKAGVTDDLVGRQVVRFGSGLNLCDSCPCLRLALAQILTQRGGEAGLLFGVVHGAMR